MRCEPASAVFRHVCKKVLLYAVGSHLCQVFSTTVPLFLAPSAIFDGRERADCAEMCVLQQVGDVFAWRWNTRHCERRGEGPQRSQLSGLVFER